MHPVGSGLSKNIVSIHYPGVVKNENKMLETLGGIRNISTVYCEKNKNLRLRMRPDDVFSKSICSSRTAVIALVLKIKIKKKKKEVVSYEIVGNVCEEFKFEGLCDFQFLPTTKDKSLYDDIVPNGIDPDWLQKECGYFLPPVSFSRIDSVQNINLSKITTEGDQPNVIGRLRRKRYGYTKIVNFENPEVPTKPKDIPSGGLNVPKLISQEALGQLRVLFEKRPIYSKSAIICISKIPPVQLKCMLPCVAYHFTNGPWRALWVRFGYDPRKDPSSRIYQTLDYRVKSHYSREEIKHKRNISMPTHQAKQTREISKNSLIILKNQIESTDKESKKHEENSHIFRAGIIPPSRQCYYQYCDLHVPEIQTMLDNLPMVDDQAECHEIHGWLPHGMADDCRKIINGYVDEEIKRRNELFHSTSQSQIKQSYSSSESEFSDPE